MAVAYDVGNSGPGACPRAAGASVTRTSIPTSDPARTSTGSPAETAEAVGDPSPPAEGARRARERRWRLPLPRPSSPPSAGLRTGIKERGKLAGVRFGFYEALYLAYAAAALLIFTFWVAPFQKADEPAHYLRAVSLTNLDFTCKKGEDGSYYFSMKRRYADLPDLMHYWDVWHGDARFDFKWLRQDFSSPVYDEEVRLNSWCGLPFPGYLPTAAGVFAGKPFANPLIGFYLARAFSALFFLGAMVLALRTAPERYRMLVLLYGALPTVLHQASAISYDAVQLSLFPLIFALLTKFVVDEAPAKRGQLALFGGLLIWVTNVRLLAYYPMLLLFMVITPEKVARPFRRYVAMVAVFFGLTMLVTAGLGALYVSRATEFGPGDYPVDAQAQVRHVISHPESFLVAMYHSLDRYGEDLLRGTIGFFGWIKDYGFNYFPYYVVTFIAGIVVFRVAQKDGLLLRPPQLLALAGAVVLTVGSVFFSLYAVWSPVGGDMVHGVQGRYFLGLLPFAAVLGSQTAALLGKDRLVKVLVVAVAAMLIFNMFRAVDLRYH